LWLCGVAVTASRDFRRVCATTATLIGFFFAMLQKHHAAEYRALPRELPLQLQSIA
jgi:hypothetical protein